MSDKELIQEIAVMLFQKEKLTLGQAANLAGMSQIQFQHLLETVVNHWLRQDIALVSERSTSQNAS